MRRVLCGVCGGGGVLVALGVKKSGQIQPHS